MTTLAALAIPLLLAAGPSTKHREKLMVFGRLAGEWTFKGASYDDRGMIESTDAGDIQIAWILGGTALQDVWKETYTSDGSPGIFGTTVRFYDSRIDAWHSVWMDPVTGSARMFIGHQTRDGIAFEGTDRQNKAIRWCFSEVTASTFRWYAQREIAPRKWQIYEDLRAVRRGAPKKVG